MATTVTIRFNRFPEIAAKLPREASQVVRKATFDVEAQGKDRVPVITGNLKSGIRSRISADGLEGVAGVGPAVGSDVEYAEFVEFGTRRASARPYMTPAAEVVEPAYQEAMRQLLQRL